MRWCVAAILLFAQTAFGQFGETIEVRLHNLDVVVETRKGELVTGLTKEDFIVKQDGKEQTITHFFVNSEPNEFVNVPLPANTVTKKRDTRRLVFFLDETPLHEKARKDLLDQVTVLLQSMAPNDEVMIVTPAAAKHVPLFFTTDKTRAQHMIAELTLQMMRIRDAEALGTDIAGVPIMEDFISEELPDGFLRRGDCSQSLEQCSKNRIEVLQATVESLAAVPGRKVLLMISRRFTSSPGWEMQAGNEAVMVENPVTMLSYPAVLTHGKDLKPLIEKVARAAAASNVTIYGIEPYEPGEVVMAGISAEQKDKSPTLERGEPGVLDAMMMVSRLTGGRAFGGTREFDNLFQQVARDQAFFYSLAYPDRGERNVGHDVEVSIRNRPGLVVRTRRHVAATSMEAERAQRAVGALLTAKPINALGIVVALDDFVKQGRFIEIPVTIRIPFSRLTMVPREDRYHGSVQLSVAVVEGDKLEFGTALNKKVQEIVLSESQWEGSRNGYFNYNNIVRVRPGRYRISIGVTDAASGESGFQTFDIVAKADTKISTGQRNPS